MTAESIGTQIVDTLNSSEEYDGPAAELVIAPPIYPEELNKGAKCLVIPTGCKTVRITRNTYEREFKFSVILGCLANGVQAFPFLETMGAVARILLKSELTEACVSQVEIQEYYNQELLQNGIFRSESTVTVITHGIL